MTGPRKAHEYSNTYYSKDNKQGQYSHNVRNEAARRAITTVNLDELESSKRNTWSSWTGNQETLALCTRFTSRCGSRNSSQANNQLTRSYPISTVCLATRSNPATPEICISQHYWILSWFERLIGRNSLLSIQRRRWYVLESAASNLCYTIRSYRTTNAWILSESMVRLPRMCDYSTPFWSGYTLAIQT